MPPSDWTLEIREDTGEVRHVPIATDVVIGRALEAEVVLDRPSVSRRHAKLSRAANGAWRVADLGSRGGTLLNGERVTQETPLKSGDVLTVSQFELRLVHASEQQRRVRTHSASAVQLAPEDSPDISVLSRVAPPRLDSSMIASLSDFGRTLIELPSTADRLARLCELMCGDMIHGRWALALRIDPTRPEAVPHAMATFPPDTGDGRRHVSRSTLRAAREARAPVLASNIRKDSGVVEMSIVSQAPPSAAVGCPIGEDGTQVLYVNLPPVFGTTEWLALIALAVKQYEQAEASWRLREAVRAQAALERDLANARQIQLSILPKPVEAPGLDIAWRFAPCDSVGGDLVDVVALPDGRRVLAIADATGHGLPAALASLAVHGILQTCLRSGMPLREVMRMLNEHLCDYLPAGRFVTMLCLLIDPRTGAVECVNAGHHAASVFTGGGDVRAMQEAEHLPLGLERGEYSVASDQLAPGDVVLLSTDGLTELPLAAGGMLRGHGVQELVSSVLREAPAGMEQAAEAMRVRLDALRGDQPRLDDETFLIVRRTS